MKKITIVAVALILLCFVSGGYALYNNINDVADIPASNSAVADSANPKTDSISNDENTITADISNKLVTADISNKLESVSKALEYSTVYSVIYPTHNIFVPEDFDLNGYAVSNSDYFSFYVPEGYDTTDKFAQCAECGKYFSYGAVTKALPEYAVCHGHDDCAGAVFDPTNPHVLSYDEVMFYLENHKAPESVYNRVSDYFGDSFNYNSYSDYVAGITKEPEQIHTMPVTELVQYQPVDSVEDNSESSAADDAVQNVSYY